MTKVELKKLLNKYNLSPNKIRGQNFLISDNTLNIIIKKANIQVDELILEIGPGLGSLTKKLIKNSKKVIAIEVDKNFKNYLNFLKKDFDNLEIIWQDILSLTNKQFKKILIKSNLDNYKIVANIPYYLTSKLINKFLSFKKQPLNMILMVQKEVADRMVAKKNSLLSLAISFYADVEIVDIVKKENFYPIPKVNSAIINIYNIHKWNYNIDENKLWILIRRGFSSKRKKLINNLSTDINLKKEKLIKIFDKINIDKNIRAEDLSKENWIDLFINIY